MMFPRTSTLIPEMKTGTLECPCFSLIDQHKIKFLHEHWMINHQLDRLLSDLYGMWSSIKKKTLPKKQNHTVIILPPQESDSN